MVVPLTARFAIEQTGKLNGYAILLLTFPANAL